MPVSLPDLWLPILASGVAVFFLGYLMWMVLPHHRKDWAGLANEDQVVEALRSKSILPGQYAFPHCASAEAMRDPEWQRRYREGPTGFLVLRRPGPITLVQSMVGTLVTDLVIALLVAYVASITLIRGAEYLDVFRVVGTTAILAFAGAHPTYALWFEHSWSSVLKHVLDGVVYGLVTAGLFASLWPA